MKVLIIEDMRTERAILKYWLEEINCEVIEASNGNEGIDHYHEYLPDLVVTDIVMPEKEGIQMMIELRREYPDARIIAISGAGIKEPGEYLPLAKDLGAIQTFVKPIDKEKFLKAVLEVAPTQ